MKPTYRIVTAALIASLALAPSALAAGKGQGAQKQTRSMNQIQKRDGSCTQTGTQKGTKAMKGNTYGLGDGSGNQGVGPKDGTGYGAPANR
jgi:hypothetical protein